MQSETSLPGDRGINIGNSMLFIEEAVIDLYIFRYFVVIINVVIARHLLVCLKLL